MQPPPPVLLGAGGGEPLGTRFHEYLFDGSSDSNWSNFTIFTDLLFARSVGKYVIDGYDKTIVGSFIIQGDPTIMTSWETASDNLKQKTSGLKKFELGSQEMHTHQALTAAYKDSISIVLWRSQDIIVIERPFLSLGQRHFLTRIFVKQTEFISILYTSMSVHYWFLGKNIFWAIFPRVKSDGVFCLWAIWDSIPRKGTYYTRHQAPRAHFVPATILTAAGSHFSTLKYKFQGAWWLCIAS